LPHHFQSFSVARLDTLAAGRATSPVDPVWSAENRPFRTTLLAVAAANAPFQEKAELRRVSQRFWILTPLTSERTTLEKDNRSDPRTIVNRVPLDIEYDCLLASHLSSPFFMLTTDIGGRILDF
jgi:hypothetical protein